MRISDWSSDVCSSDLLEAIRSKAANFPSVRLIEEGGSLAFSFAGGKPTRPVSKPLGDLAGRLQWMDGQRSEEHKSELKSLMRIEYAVFCMKKKKQSNK